MTAEAGLRARLAAGENGSGSGTGAARHALPALAQLLVRRGAEDAQAVLARAVAFAREADSSYELVPALLAEIEQAWLLDRPAAARAAVATLDERTAGPVRNASAASCGGGSDGSASRSRRSPAARTSWRRASAATGGRPPRRGRRLGDPYAAALELAEGDAEARLAALPGSTTSAPGPAAARVRRDLRRAGVTVIPRGPKPTTRENPAGLTDRQVEILRLLADGATNAEIAARLVLSVRTVDHHVSAVLQKLGVPGRREAIAAAAALGLAR